METEYEEVQSSLEEKGGGVTDVCEEILLPTVSSVTNGAAAGDSAVTAVEYLEEENDPMTSENDLIEDFNEGKQKAGKSLVTRQDEGYEEENDCEAEDVVEELVEEVEEEVDEQDEEGEITAERKPTQVPKKRRDAALLAAAAEEFGVEEEEDVGEEEEEGANNTEEDEVKSLVEAEARNEEKPTSSRRAAANEENSVAEEQCRVCTSKEDLVSLFKKVEKQTVAEMLMTICPTVSIARKDFMPQYICNPCLDNVTISVQLKTQCETTERELRKKLSRSKNKVRRPAGYVVIDAPVESDPPSEEELNDDVEFKVSDVEVSASADDDSEDSDFSNKKKRVLRGAGSKRGRRKSAVAATPTPKPKPKEKKRVGRPPTKRPAVRAASSDEEKEEFPIMKKKRFSAGAAGGKQSPAKPLEFPCDECEQIFTRKLSLVLHKKVHLGSREPINCKICGRQFKMHGAYRTHMEKHKMEPVGHDCEKCDSVFPNKADLRRHLADEHGEHGMVYLCNKCKRTFVSETRLIRHRDGRCPGHEPKPKKNDFEGLAVGKDLFSSVAPLTTTYWSDSFSD